MAALSLEQIVSKTTELPTFPAAALAIIRETNNPESSARTIAEYVKQDQAIAARVLRLVNSAHYGMARQISNIPEAVVLLGMRTIQNLALIASTYPWLSKPLKGYDLGPKAMWTHSFAVAAAAELVAKKSRRVDPALCFTAGLLHNVGKVAISVWLEDRVQAFVALAIRDNLTFDQVERKVLGYDHAEVGAYLGETWNLPSNVIEAIRWHHEPNHCPEPSLVVDAVHIGDFMTMSMGFGLGADGLRYDFCEDTLVRVGLKAEEIEELLAEFIEVYEKYEQLLEGF